MIQNYFRKKFENEMEWSFQKLYLMPKIATAYEDFVLKNYGEFLDTHSKNKKNKQADKDSHD